jgi:hypothetical protein
MTARALRARHRWRAARLGATLAATAAFAAVALTPSTARAGSYPMYACNVPGKQTGTRGPWVLNPQPVPTGATTNLNTFDNCAIGGGFGFFQGGVPMNPGSIAGAYLYKPAGFQLGQQKSYLVASLTGTGSPTAIYAETESGLEGAWSSPGANTLGSPDVRVLTGKNVFAWDLYCAAVASQPCDLDAAYPLNIVGIENTLLDSTLPLHATVDGGSLTTAGAKKGVKTLRVTATDDHSGTQKVDILLEDAVVAAIDYDRNWSQPLSSQKAGTCQFADWNACQTSQTPEFTIDTAQVPDGVYALGVRTTDAAGNRRTTTWAQTVTIDNVPDAVAPVAPDPVAPSGKNGANGLNGADGRDGRDGAGLTLNGTNGSSAATLKAAFASSKRSTIKSAYGKKVLITGRLTAPGGRPIAGARLWVMQQDKMVGAKMIPAGEVTTDRAGMFRYVTTAQRSRTIRFGYRTHLQDMSFSQTTDISLGVVAKVSLRTDRRSLPNGQAVRFSGSIAGAPANARKVVELQVKKGKRWMTFRSTRLRGGGFSERYRFTRTRGRATYAFRARVRQEAGFPFMTGVSKQVKVTVRG